MNLTIIEASDALRDPRVRALRDRLRRGPVAEGNAEVESAVRQILADVEARGDDALVEWERKLDRADLAPQTLRVPRETIEAAHRAASGDFLGLVRRAAANVREFQETIRVPDPPPLRRGGRELRLRYTPIDRVGLYVPGGQAVYPSSLLMTLVPALVAGVPQIALTCPPRCNGDVNPVILAVACELGVTEVYRLGGAVAIAALAIGTPSVPPVDKVLGPGNAFVIEAKRRLFGRVGIDSTAGPSEVLIIADDVANPAHVAADLLAQAEHDPGSAILVTPSASLARSVVAAVQEQLPSLSRAAAIGPCLEAYGAIIVVPSLAAACDLANDLAPEHLQVMTAEDDAVAAAVRNAGAIFLGPAGTVALGDYYAGPSHVLPTGGTARFFGPLSVNDFRKATSMIRYDARSLAEDARDVVSFADLEGLTAHAEAVRRRLRQFTGARP